MEHQHLNGCIALSLQRVEERIDTVTTGRSDGLIAHNAKTICREHHIQRWNSTAIGITGNRCAGESKQLLAVFQRGELLIGSYSGLKPCFRQLDEALDLREEIFLSLNRRDDIGRESLQGIVVC